MERKWWHDATVYQIYPRSFMDSNGDGIGDLQGIISKLDYLEDLGITVIWLSPVYDSPMDDNGYDISNYQAIAPEFGTMADMDQLIQEANDRGIKIMMDLVVNHTSDEHPWFVEAKASKENPYRDYYIFREPKDGGAPSEIGSVFSGSAWEYVNETEDYYFHLFSKKQPDLNWENPKVAAEIYDMMNWWLDKGIGGFRMDVIDLIGKEIDLGITGNGPTLHTKLKEMNQATFGSRDVVTVGETWGASPEIAKLYSAPEREELSMVFQFEHVSAFTDPVFGKWKPVPVDFQILKGILAKWQTELASEGWNSLFWNNHDLPRAVSKFGSVVNEESRLASAKMLATMLHGMKGTPYVYQGEELGMTNVIFDEISDYKDIEILNAYQAMVEPFRDGSQMVHPEGEPFRDGSQKAQKLSHDEMMAGIYENGRDNARTPMHWSDEAHGGFTTGNPWIKANPNHKTINVRQAATDPNSVLNHYKKLISLRKDHPVLVYGDFEWLDSDSPSSFSYLRKFGDTKLLVLTNHTANEIDLNLTQSFEETEWEVLIASELSMDGSEKGHLTHFRTVPKRLKPFESLLLLNR